jgi:hypothetical protein
MVNYSQVLNNEITEINTIAVDNFGEDSFIGGSSVSVVQTTFSGVSQNQEVTATHASDTDGIRLVQILELIPEDGLYEVRYNTDYTVQNYSDTQTKVIKLSSGTDSIKVNILI